MAAAAPTFTDEIIVRFAVLRLVRAPEDALPRCTNSSRCARVRDLALNVGVDEARLLHVLRAYPQFFDLVDNQEPFIVRLTAEWARGRLWRPSWGGSMRR